MAIECTRNARIGCGQSMQRAAPVPAAPLRSRSGLARLARGVTQVHSWTRSTCNAERPVHPATPQQQHQQQQQRGATEQHPAALQYESHADVSGGAPGECLKDGV